MGTLNLAAPSVLFEKSRLLPSFHHHPIQHNNTTQTVTLTISPTSTFSRKVVCPSGAWFENRPHLTPSIHLVWNPRHIIVQWVGIGTHINRSSIQMGMHMCSSREWVCENNLVQFQSSSCCTGLWENGGEGIGISGSLIWSKPWWNWYLTPVVNFGEVRRTQLVKSTFLTSTLVPLGSFQIFYSLFRC